MYRGIPRLLYRMVQFRPTLYEKTVVILIVVYHIQFTT